MSKRFLELSLDIGGITIVSLQKKQQLTPILTNLRKIQLQLRIIQMSKNSKITTFERACYEMKAERGRYMVKQEAFNAKVMYSDLRYMMDIEPKIEADAARIAKRGVNKANKAIRAMQGRDAHVDNAFRVAHSDFVSQRAAQQRDAYREYRAAKKHAKRVAEFIAGR